MRKMFVALAVATAALAGFPAEASPPRLLVVLSIDQLSSDLFEGYRPHFTAGLARLAGGTVFTNGYQSHAATETCPGHSTILTGARPARSGIIANSWADPRLPRANKTVYCAEDVTARPGPGESYVVSAINLKVPTLGELMKARHPHSRNVAVAGKDRAAVMLGGKTPDQRWYWTGKQFATELQDRPVPRSVAAASTAAARLIAAGSPPLDPPVLCQARAAAVPLLGGGAPVGAGRLEIPAGDERAFRASPAFDGAVLALGAALVHELKLGRGPEPDILSLGLSATDYVGHAFGTGGAEMCLQLLSLDRNLGDFFGELDRLGLDYAVVLTADHGGADVPERLLLKGVSDASRVDPALAVATVSNAIEGKLGLTGPVLIGNSGGDTLFGDIYLSAGLAPADRARVMAEAIAIYRRHPQVEAVLTREQLIAAPNPSGPPDKWTLLARAKASFDPQRSGDFIVFLKPHVTPIADTRRYTATHGSAWDYDRRVPILFWRRGMPAASRPEAIETIDIMPTAAAMLGLGSPPVPVDGKCLHGVLGVNCPRR